jgi:negative regulator of replication initiation
MAQVQKPRTIRMDDETWKDAQRLASNTGEVGTSVSDLLRKLVVAERDIRNRSAQ